MVKIDLKRLRALDQLTGSSRAQEMDSIIDDILTFTPAQTNELELLLMDYQGTHKQVMKKILHKYKYEYYPRRQKSLETANIDSKPIISISKIATNGISFIRRYLPFGESSQQQPQTQDQQKKSQQKIQPEKYHHSLQKKEQKEIQSQSVQNRASQDLPFEEQQQPLFLGIIGQVDKGDFRSHKGTTGLIKTSKLKES